MSVFYTLSTTSLTLLIVGLSLGAAILIVLFYFLFWRNKKLQRQVRDLDRKYDYLHNLLTQQDFNYVKRLEYISQVNLLYGEIHDKHLRRYTYLNDNKDLNVKKNIEDLRNAISLNKYYLARKKFPNVKKLVIDLEEEITSLNDDLIDIIRPEEDCNRIFLEVKENYRIVHNEYLQKESDLILVKESYTEVFKYIEELFNKFDTYVGSANYDDATNLIPQTQKILKELDIINKVMPELVNLADRTLPFKINDLESEYKKMINENVPVNHLLTDETIIELKNKLAEVVTNLKNFSYHNQKEIMESMIKIIENYFENFNIEREAKISFERDVDEIFAKVNSIEKSFIKLCNSIPKIKKYYILEEAKISQRNNIQKDINKIGVSKRSLDTFIHSASKKPYSLLLKKTNDLKKEASEIDDEMNNFRNYLSSLKQDVEDAHDLIFSTYYRVRKYEKVIRDSSIENFANKYKEKIEEIYKQLEIINTTVAILPIDVKKINEAVTYLKFNGESTLNQIEQDSNTMKMTESAILYLNARRINSPEIRNILDQSEKMFYDGDFDKAYDTTTNIVYKMAESEKRAS